MASIPLSAALIKTFKVRSCVVVDVEKWEAWMVPRLVAKAPEVDWSGETYRLHVVLQQNRWPMLTSFDPESRFFRFMDEWRAQTVHFHTQRLVDYRCVNSMQMVVIVPSVADRSEERKATSRMLALLGLDADVSDEDLNAMDESDDEITSGSEILSSMSSRSSSTANSANTTPQPLSKQQASMPIIVMSPYVTDDDSSPVEEIPCDSLTGLMLKNLNLRQDCSRQLRSLDVNIQFRIRTNKIDLPDILVVVRSFCRSNAGAGFYDNKGCLVSLVESWYQQRTTPGSINPL